MTAAVHQDVELTQGDTLTLKFGPVLDGQGNPVDLSGQPSAIWRVGKSAYAASGDIYLTKSSALTPGDVTFVSTQFYEQTQWSVWVALQSTDTALLPSCIPPQTWFHQLQVTDRLGNTSTAATGNFTVDPSMDNT
jgi:hypothetical protein